MHFALKSFTLKSFPLSNGNPNSHESAVLRVRLSCNEFWENFCYRNSVEPPKPEYFIASIQESVQVQRAEFQSDKISFHVAKNVFSNSKPERASTYRNFKEKHSSSLVFHEKNWSKL